MNISSSVFRHWRYSLLNFVTWFEVLRKTTRNFYLKAFSAFILLNFSCYWWAIFTAYPRLIFSVEAQEIIIMGFPVALFGGAFDSLSLLVTILIVKRALKSKNNSSYVLYLGIDLLIAIVASFWVLFVFIVSGWMVSYVLAIPETIGSRVWLYEERVASAISNPFNSGNLRNIYFGIIMGASASLATLLHIFLACQSFLRSVSMMLGLMRSDS